MTVVFPLVVGALACGVAALLLFGLRAGSRSRMQAAARAAAVAAAGAGAAIYLLVGTPEFADPDLDLEAGPTLIRLLERQAGAQPNLPGPLINLAEALDAAGRPEDAAPVWQRAAALGGDQQTFALARAAQSLIVAADGAVTPGASELLDAVLQLDPTHVPARFYAGLTMLQQGHAADAHTAWTALLADIPEESEFHELVESGVREAAARITAEGPPSEPGPEIPDDSQIRAMVEGLAARLEQNPDDIEGWKRLGRSRHVLEQFDLSYAAYMQAVERSPEDTDALAGAAEALLFASEDPARLPAEAVTLLRRVLELRPDHALALYVVAEDAVSRNDPAEARKLLDRLLETLPPDAPSLPVITERIRVLEEAG